MSPPALPRGESPAIPAALLGVLYPVPDPVVDVVVNADDAVDTVESRRESNQLPPPPLLLPSPDEFLRSYRLSCATLCMSIADPRLFGGGPSVSTFIPLGTPGPTSDESISSREGVYALLSVDIFLFVP